MKVRQQIKTKKDHGRKGPPNVRVNLINLSREKINAMMSEIENVTTLNFSLKLQRSGDVICTSAPDSVQPIISSGGNISISLRTGLTAKSGYELRTRPQNTTTKKPKLCIPTTTVSQLSVTTQKNHLWAACKKNTDKSKICEGSFVFGKQAGYAPWPGHIMSINKSRTSAIVKYCGFDDFKGTVKLNELVQVDDASVVSICALTSFTLKTKAIKEFDRFSRAIKEVQGSMKF